MNAFVRTAVGLLSTLLISCGYNVGLSQTAADSKHVGFDDLKESHASCSVVTFSVRSTSEIGVYLEIYVENFQNGSWELVDYAYDLKQPMSLYVKRAMVDPKLMKSGESMALSYDRCSKPKFVEGTERIFKKAIVEKDKASTSPVLQRFHADVYSTESGKLKLVAREYSPQFSRVAPTD